MLNRWNGRLCGSTLPEILIVIILSGILLLLLFEGINIIYKYNYILRNKLTIKNELFHSHSTLELIMAETDSIRVSEEEHILLFYKSGEVKHIISLYNKGFQVLYEGLNDTIFVNNLGWKLHSIDNDLHKIDSIYITTPIDSDTLNLEYGLSTIHHSIKLDI